MQRSAIALAFVLMLFSGPPRFAFAADDQTFSSEEIMAKATGFFGETTEGLAKAVEHVFGDLGRPNASSEVLTAFSATPERQNMNRKLGLDRAQLLPRAAALRRRLAEELERARGRTALISGEHIPLLQPAELSAFADFVRTGAGSLRAVGYVREPQGCSPPASATGARARRGARGHTCGGCRC